MFLASLIGDMGTGRSIVLSASHRVEANSATEALRVLEKALANGGLTVEWGTAQLGVSRASVLAAILRGPEPSSRSRKDPPILGTARLGQHSPTRRILRNPGALVEQDQQVFDAYSQALDSAGNEEQKRQAFVALAAAVFRDTSLVNRLTLGAEYKVKFERCGLVRRGSADALFGNVVMEFETDLSKTGTRALEQLRNYVAGAWAEDGHNRRPYLAVATDGNKWEVYSTTPLDMSAGLGAENVDLAPLDTCSFTEPEGAAAFRNFLNRLFYRDFTLAPTAENIARDFGPKSVACKVTRRALATKASELDSDVQYRTLRDQWDRSLRIAYGSSQSSDELFVLHTYLAGLARLLVWAALEQRVPSESDVKAVLHGEYFISKKIQNLWEDDFFKWPDIISETDIHDAWIGLAGQFAVYDMTLIDEDVLKPLYEELVDADVRHGLGEYYTPDWLAARVTQRTLHAWPWQDGLPAILDPTCGSGTFLRAAIAEIRRARPESTLDDLLSHVAGFDVHPLAVIVARATYTLAVMDLIDDATDLVSIPVYISDSFTLPDTKRQEDLFGEDNLPVFLGDTRFDLPAEFVLQADLFDHGIGAAVDVARAYGALPSADPSDITASLTARIGDAFSGLKSAARTTEKVVALTLHLTELVRRREDSFFGFVVRNGQRPSILREKFDYVVGNPPWLTIGDVETSEYKARLTDFCANTEIAGRGMGEQAHTDLSTLFLGHVTKTFLRPDDNRRDSIRVGFVMTRSVFAASHHGNLREGKYSQRLQMDVREIWDLAGVTPLFRVPACVLFAAKAGATPQRLKSGRIFKGALPNKDAAPDKAKAVLSEQAVKYELAFLAERSAWRIHDGSRPLLPAQKRPTKSPNAYVSRFRQGAILYPQSLLVVTAEGSIANRKIPIRVRTNLSAVKASKKLTSVRVDRLIDGQNLFCTAAGEHILPYALARPLWTVILPTVTEPGDPAFGPVDVAALRRGGRLHTAEWLEWAEKHWEKARKESEDAPMCERLDTYGHLSGQAGRGRFVVLYNASGGRPVCCAFDTHDLPLPFVARDKTYWSAYDTPEEAAYVSAFLNSDFLAASIRDWMTTGLFGARDIHKRALDIVWPKFETSDSNHTDLATLATSVATAAGTAAGAVAADDVGRQRVEVRSAIAPEDLAEIERLVSVVASRA